MDGDGRAPQRPAAEAPCGGARNESGALRGAQRARRRMLFADIDILDENLDLQTHRWVGVRDGRIAYLGKRAPGGAEAEAYGEVYDGRGKLLVPAFYNAHAHAPMTLLRGYAEDLPLQGLAQRSWCGRSRRR